VLGWSGVPGSLFIEWEAAATFGGAPIGWRAVDRFRLADGKVLERVAYFDSLTVAAAFATRPRGWLHLARALARRG
jgi:hypothetical protein